MDVWKLMDKLTFFWLITKKCWYILVSFVDFAGTQKYPDTMIPIIKLHIHYP